MSKAKSFIPAIVMIVTLIGISIYTNVFNTFKDIQYKFTGLKFSMAQSLETGLQDLFFTINLVLTNNHATVITIDAIDFDVLYNNVKIATVSQDTGINILPKQSSISVLNIEVITDNLPNSIATALQQISTGNTKFQLAFNGTITTQLGKFPVKQTLNIGS